MSERWKRSSRARWWRALILAFVVVAVPAPALAQVTSGGAPAITVVVDPTRCSQPARVAEQRVVCSLSQVPGQLRSGGTVVLGAGRHRGPLDLRGLVGVTVRGEPGAVVEAGRAPYALSLREVRDVTVRTVKLSGGTAQTIWVDRTARVTLDRVVVEGAAGAGLQVRDSRAFRFVGSRVAGAASAGVMELAGVVGSRYERLTVTGNGRGAAPYNGDGLQLSGSGVVVKDVLVTGNGSSPRYEHGVYVSSRARDVVLSGVTSRGNSGVAVKLGGSGRLERSALHDDGTALYCATTAGAGWTVQSTTITGASRMHREKGCRWTVLSGT